MKGVEGGGVPIKTQLRRITISMENEKILTRSMKFREYKCSGRDGKDERADW